MTSLIVLSMVLRCHLSATHRRSECFDRSIISCSALRNRRRMSSLCLRLFDGIGNCDGSIGIYSKGPPARWVIESRFSPAKPHHTNAPGHRSVIAWIYLMQIKEMFKIERDFSATTKKTLTIALSSMITGRWCGQSKKSQSNVSMNWEDGLNRCRTVFNACPLVGVVCLSETLLDLREKCQKEALKKLCKSLLKYENEQNALTMAKTLA